MNKVLKIVCLFLLLCACSSKEAVKNVSCGILSETKATELLDGYEPVLQENEYSVGTGIFLAKVEGNLITDSEKKIYPVYLDEDIVFYILENGEDHQIVVSEMAADRMKEGTFVIFEENESIYYLDEKGAIDLLNKESAASQDIGAAIKKRNQGRFEVNPMGEEKVKIELKKKKETSKEKIRISVLFTDGEEEEKISKFEEFCNGKLRMMMKGSKVCVFEIDRIDTKRLNKLIGDANKLEYVKSASIDQENELIEPVTETK